MRHARTGPLTAGQKCWLGIAVAFAIAGMVTGLWFSFWNLDHAAAAHGWETPALLPLMIDLGIPTYVIIDHLIVILGWRSFLPRLAAWGFASLTIVLNGAVTPSSSALWRITAAAMPAAWVLGIEVLRLIWRALRKDPSARMPRIPAGRWVASPVPTALLWRRQHLLGIRSWLVMCALEDARAYLRDTVAAIRARYPDTAVPSSVLAAVRSGRFPGEIADAISGGRASRWEPAVDAWVADRMGLQQGIADALRAPARDLPRVPSEAVPRKAPAEAIPAPSEVAVQKASAGTSRKARKPDARKASDEELLAEVRALGPGVSKYRVMKELGVGDPRATRLLASASKPRLVKGA